METTRDLQRIQKSISRDALSELFEQPPPHFDVVPVPDENLVTESIIHCNKPLCDDADLECIYNMVTATLCEALIIIQSDPRGLFCYQYPKKLCYVTNQKSQNLCHSTVCRSNHSMASETVRKWMTIGEFEYSNMVPIIRDYISQWKLSPDTKCVVLTNTRRHDVPLKGTIYFIDAHFSRPTPRCPNPLAVAKVRFVISVSSLMQVYYPVMVTFRFEGYRTLYYAMGSNSINSCAFQRFYIDTILHTKLSFFAEVCESRHGTIANPKVTKPKESNEAKESNEPKL